MISFCDSSYNTIVDHANVALHVVDGCRFEKVKQRLNKKLI